MKYPDLLFGLSIFLEKHLAVAIDREGVLGLVKEMLVARGVPEAELPTGLLKIRLSTITVGTFYPRCVSAHERTKRTHFPAF